MRFGFSYIGVIWLIMLFVPNMIWTKNKPQDYEKYTEGENKVLLVLERIGQFTARHRNNYSEMKHCQIQRKAA